MATAPPQTRRWTRDEYHRIGELGLFRGRRVELIDGVIVEMGAKGIGHVIAVSLTGDCLQSAFGPTYWVIRQDSIALTETSEPEPDVYVVPGRPRDYTATPTADQAVLVVEVSGSTLDYDRAEKASLYAQAGIADYWIVNLIDRQLEVRRRPAPDPSQPFGFGYADLQEIPAGGTATPLALPNGSIAVVDLLP